MERGFNPTVGLVESVLNVGKIDIKKETSTFKYGLIFIRLWLQISKWKNSKGC